MHDPERDSQMISGLMIAFLLFLFGLLAIQMITECDQNKCSNIPPVIIQ